MPNFKEYFYLKENNKEYIKNINSRIINNKILNIEIQGMNFKKLPDWSNIETIKGFDCGDNQIRSLIGSPWNIGADFYCNNNNIINLKGSPVILKGDFRCYANKKLISLYGATKKIGRDFDCCHNTKLSILKNGPEWVGKNFYCNNCPNIQEDQWQYLPIIQGALFTDKDLNRNELLTLQKLQAQGRIGKLMLRGKSKEIEDDNDPFNL